MTNNNLLAQIGLPQLKYLGKGMESIVYEIDKNTILKIYDEGINHHTISRLKAFYDSLDTSRVNFQTPAILSVENVNNRVVVKERRLFGQCPNKEYLQNLSREKITIFLDNYIDTLFSIQKVTTDFLSTAEPLDLMNRFFQYKKYSSWNELLMENLRYKYIESKQMFQDKVQSAEILFNNLIAKIEQLEPTNNSLIHGDFFPANTMINDELKISSVLDFGILTTVGDPIFDIALGWIFSDMYDEIKTLNVKEHLKRELKNRLTEMNIRGLTYMWFITALYLQEYIM